MKCSWFLFLFFSLSIPLSFSLSLSRSSVRCFSSAYTERERKNLLLSANLKISNCVKSRPKCIHRMQQRFYNDFVLFDYPVRGYTSHREDCLCVCKWKCIDVYAHYKWSKTRRKKGGKRSRVTKRKERASSARYEHHWNITFSWFW